MAGAVGAGFGHSTIRMDAAREPLGPSTLTPGDGLCNRVAADGGVARDADACRRRCFVLSLFVIYLKQSWFR